uniref:Membrane insertase YidC/Oxa/ALB C-terminal domain-containing protein n=1 Tax=Globodera rostochiensis TaxID=31243 RepID=A0A914HBD6_GLORO
MFDNCNWESICVKKFSKCTLSVHARHIFARIAFTIGRELARTGHSVLDELGLWSWWKPSSWMRWGLEYSHFALDIPWWSTIVIATVVLRLICFPIPLQMRRLTAIQQKYGPELLEFSERMQKAQREGNNALSMQVVWEQKDFMSKKGINVFKHLPMMVANGAVFMTMFCSLKRLANSKYPGFEQEGFSWFSNLTVGDPYWVLPIYAATTLHWVFRSGIEAGNLATMPKLVKYGMLYGLPLVLLLSANHFTSAVCLYWCTSNSITLLFSLLFRSPRIQQILKLPPPPSKEFQQLPKMKLSAIKKDFQEVRSASAPPSLSTLKKKDLEQFKKAGRGKPLIPGGSSST